MGQLSHSNGTIDTQLEQSTMSSRRYGTVVAHLAKGLVCGLTRRAL